MCAYERIMILVGAVDWVTARLCGLCVCVRTLFVTAATRKYSNYENMCTYNGCVCFCLLATIKHTQMVIVASSIYICENESTE